MLVRTDQLKEWFSLFNERYFNGELPEPVLAVGKSRTRLGTMSWKTKKKFFCVSTDGYTIRISNYFDMEEKQYKSVLLHEMIHLHIVFNKIKDTSAHGIVFRKIMRSINADGWEISVSARIGNDIKRNGITKKRRRIVLAAVTKDGRHLLSVVNPRYMASLNSIFEASRDIASFSWYTSDDDYFASFPVVRTPKGRIVTPEKHAYMMARMKPLEP